MPRQLPPPSVGAISRMLWISDQRTTRQNAKSTKPNPESHKEHSDVIKRAVRAFSDFCDAQNIPEDARLPAEETLLCAYAASALLSHPDAPVPTEPSDARSQMAALRTWHAHNGVPWRGGERLKLVLRGMDNIVNRARADARQQARLGEDTSSRASSPHPSGSSSLCHSSPAGASAGTPAPL